MRASCDVLCSLGVDVIVILIDVGLFCPPLMCDGQIQGEQTKLDKNQKRNLSIPRREMNHDTVTHIET